MNRLLVCLAVMTAIFCAVIARSNRWEIAENGADLRGDFEFDRYNDKHRDQYEDDNYAPSRREYDESSRSRYDPMFRDREDRLEEDGGDFRTTTSESQDNVNQFVDYLLHAVGSLGMVSKTRAHVHLPNVRKHFSKKWFGINFTGEATLYNCYIENGLSTIHRVRNADLSTQRNGTHLNRRIRFEFRIKYLQVASNFTIKFLKHGPSGQFIATTDEIVVGTEIRMSSRIEDNNFNADLNMDVTYWDYITFEGLEFKIIEIWSTTKKIVKIMNPFITKMYKRRLTDNIKYKLQLLMTQVVQDAGADRNNRTLRALTGKFL